MKQRLLELIADLLDGSLDEEARGELNALLLADAEARRFYREHMELHARLHLAYSGGGLSEAMPDRLSPAGISNRRRTRKILPLAAAAIICLGVFLFLNGRGPKPVATLVSNENAAWVSSLPTTPGSDLAPGLLNLKSGVATIRFRSGAEVVLEAPASLELLTSMRGRLRFGAAVIEVPEPATGFILETPNSYAVDHGTKFAVRVDDSGRESAFEVISGQISVHHPATGEKQLLGEAEAVSATASGLAAVDRPLSEVIPPVVSKPLRIGTKGRTASVIRQEAKSRALDPDLLMVKSAVEGESEFDRRSLLAFDLSAVDLRACRAARLRLNLVPTGRGLAARLPETIRFGVYGVTDEAREDWAPGLTWEQVPSLEEADLLGTIEIPRSRQSGSEELATDQLLAFLQADTTGSVTLILTRETKAPAGNGLVHAFASDSHPEAAGPTLELSRTGFFD